MKVTTVRDVPFGEWSSAVLALRDEGYAYFDWLTAVDQTDAAPAADGADGTAPEGREAGFDVVCHLLRITEPGDAAPEAADAADAGTPRADRLGSVLLRTRAPEGLAVPSLTGIFAGAAWHERETHEMFGIDFDGFDDGTGLGLRPLLLPDGFEGTPLRKSFVLTARASKPWPGAKEPGEGHGEVLRSTRRRVQAPGVPDPEWGPR